MDKIVWAIKNGDLDQVKAICDAEPIDMNAEMSARFPLHIAADYGQADVLIYLLEKGAKVDQVDKHGITPLLAAIWEGHTRCVEVLLDHGANKLGKTPDGQSYESAAEKPDIKVLLR